MDFTSSSGDKKLILNQIKSSDNTALTQGCSHRGNAVLSESKVNKRTIFFGFQVSLSPLNRGRRNPVLSLQQLFCQTR